VKTVSQDLLNEITRRLVAEFKPEQIYLFGSHAWGSPNQVSDLDLMVVVGESKERPICRMQRAHRCLWGLPVSKDVFVQTRQGFDLNKDLRGSFQHQILEGGRRLCG